ncbi:tRNA-splicing endonuclease subunit sen54 [Pseudocyphellaria aurata]|nr:tRNA-splicing endonuclease subunit sen54 [Pseudocyphellaria aurata]
MADVDEDVIPPPPPPNDPSTELDEEIQDFRFLSALSQSTPGLPRRGIKDFEPDRTSSQRSALQSSRDAMHAALSCSRMQTPKAALRATYSPDTGRVRVGHPRGTHFRTMGTALKKGDGDGDGGEGAAGVVMLKEEEALYLVERGAMELRYEVSREEDNHWGAGKRVIEEEEVEVEEEEEQKEGIREKREERGIPGEIGIPMSVQAAYAFLIGAGHGLTLERFIVYSGLKRSGYIVLRAPGWDGDQEHGDGAGEKVKNENSGDAAQMQQQQQPLGCGIIIGQVQDLWSGWGFIEAIVSIVLYP